MPRKILIVDDEKDMLSLLSRIISEQMDHQIEVQPSPQKALEMVRNTVYDLIVTDLKMPKLNGIQFLEEIKQIYPKIPVIIMTAFATIDTAVEAIQKGAFDYITKPFDRNRILMTINKALRWQELVSENDRLKQVLLEQQNITCMVGTSRVMRDIQDRIMQVAPTMGTVLITGDSGTGKELVASTIHEKSMRKTKKFITINCTALPEEVIESELFGHVKGAFTGAWKDKKGLVEEAHEGTLFLDEIGDLSPRLQTKLLRLLQEGEYKPVGSVVTHKADIRFIAATNHNLREDIKIKTFREDLYYRLNVIHIELPPLKDRKEDIMLLSHTFLKRYAAINKKQINDISPDAISVLMSYDFPGNVRELENIIERGVIFCKLDTLSARDLYLDADREDYYSTSKEDFSELSFREAKERMIFLFHRNYIQDLLSKNEGNISKAANKAGIQRQYLHRLIKETGIETDLFKKSYYE